MADEANEGTESALNMIVSTTETSGLISIDSRLKTIENAACPCNEGDQTINHLLNQCILLQQTAILRHNVLKSENWPASKQDLITKHLKSFLMFTKSVDFDQLQ